ncbi:MAG TPA: tyrosine-type recombinase/integrase [Polyangiaceae bacterium]|nr:tyrosine-type recombinase/integrase [Polyangiaceae bacterium]
MTPIPQGFPPRTGKGRAFCFLYPSEERKLAHCCAIELETRLFYGVLCREGMRADEALSLRWESIDLENGILWLDQNKTDDPRAWALRPDVVPALAACKPADASGRDLVFGTAGDRPNLALWFRRHVWQAASLGRSSSSPQRLASGYGCTTPAARS